MIASLLLATIIVSSNSVSFTTRATGIGNDTPLEFVIAGPDSDRDYETLLLTEDSTADIAAALVKAGLPRGKPYDWRKCNFWPVGPIVTFEPALETLVAVGEGFTLPRFVFTGGDGDTKMPLAVLSTYSIGQAPFLPETPIDQSAAYGRYLSKKFYAKGELVTVKVSWDGKTAVSDIVPDFPADRTVAEAVKVAKGLAATDSLATRFNGFREGQFFFRAYLPDEGWRDRMNRLTQPLEIRLNASNETATVIHEDWSGDGPDPLLTPADFTLTPEALAKNLRAFPRLDTCFFYCPAETKLERLYRLKKMMPDTIINYYVFID